MINHGHLQGERRFYLGAVVDDLFLSTGEWEFDAVGFEGPLVRLFSINNAFGQHLKYTCIINTRDTLFRNRLAGIALLIISETLYF